MAKGGEFEREIARVLTEWGTGSRNPPELWRSTQSGGWKHGDSEDVGDLCPKGPWGQEFCFHFAVECKARNEKQVDFWHALSRQDNMDIWKWWVKIYEEATPWKKCPLLIIKRDYYPVLIGFPENFPHFDHASITVTGLTFGHEGVIFYVLEEILDEYTLDDFKVGYMQWLESTT